MGKDSPAPAPQESTQIMLESYLKAFPQLLKATNEGAVSTAQSQLAANQATAPGLAKLQSELYDAYGPLLGDTANRIAASQAKSQAQSDVDVLNGPGKQLISTARQLQREEDPEFYQAREQMGGRLGELLSSVDLSGGLSGGEREEINRSISRDNSNRGILNNPSQTAVAQNAVTFGQAGYNRKAQNQGILGNALAVGTGFLPASKSGVDVLQQATGRSGMPNAGDSKFTGVDTSLGNSANALGNNLLGQVSDITQQNRDINSKRRDGLDRFNETWSSVVGSL